MSDTFFMVANRFGSMGMSCSAEFCEASQVVFDIPALGTTGEQSKGHFDCHTPIFQEHKDIKRHKGVFFLFIYTAQFARPLKGATTKVVIIVCPFDTQNIALFFILCAETL